MLDRPLRLCPLAVLDFESTWLDTGEQHPVSVALIHAELGRSGNETIFTHELIKPSVPIRPEATAIHGITDEMVAHADPICDILDRLLDGIEGRVLCSYNLPFDWGILDEQLRMAGYLEEDCPEFGFLDPLVWAKVTDKFEKGKKLTDVARRRGLVFAAHDASADAITTARVAPLLLRDLKSMKGFDHKVLDSVGSMWEWTKKEAIAWEVWFRNYCYRQNRPIPDCKWHEILGVSFRPIPLSRQQALI
jgi:DNA polymerase-3 subunit epsilon